MKYKSLAAETVPSAQANASGDKTSDLAMGAAARGSAGPVAPPTARRWQGLNREELLRRLKSWRRGLWLVALFSLIINMLMLTVPMYLMQLSDRVLVSHSLDTLYMLTIIAIGALISLSIFDAVRRFMLTRIGMRLESDLGGPLKVSGIMQGSQQNMPDVQPLRDLSSVRNFLTGPVVPMFFDLPTMPLYTLVVFLIHPDLGYIIVMGGAILFLFALINQVVSAAPLAKSYHYGSAALGRAEADVRNAQTVRSMGMIAECLLIWGNSNREAIAASRQASDRNTLVSSASKLVRFLLQIAILGWGAYLSLAGELTAGMTIAASIIASRALAPIEGTIEGWRSFVGARQAYRRIKESLARIADTKDRTLLPTPTGKLTIEKLLYAPDRNSEPIIKGISFEIPAGTSVAVIGATGAGKSTLAALLANGIQPSGGSVKLDGADLRTWDPLQLGSNLGYLTQSVELFPGTVAENIARLRPDATSEQIIEAAKFAGAHDLILNFRNSYETQINIDGSPLSGGQRQRVGLARAFFGKPRVVVLDEPDANLDRSGEKALLEAVMRAKQAGITVVLVTQRPAMLRHVDRILAISNGTIEAYSPRDVILAKLVGGSQAGSPQASDQASNTANAEARDRRDPNGRSRPGASQSDAEAGDATMAGPEANAPNSANQNSGSPLDEWLKGRSKKPETTDSD